MRICSSCEGFAPDSLSACPHCDTVLPAAPARRAGLWLKAAAGSAVAMTLMACYGAPPGGFPPGNDPADGADPTNAQPDAKAKAEAADQPEGQAEPEGQADDGTPDAEAAPEDTAEAEDKINPPADTARVEPRLPPERVPPE